MMSEESEKLGADGLLLVTPYYNKATQDGLYAHYRRIASATKLPCIIYNVPSRTGTNILPETLARLADDQENIVAVKEASGSICVAPDTLVTLADGTQKQIKDVTNTDMLMVWDFYKGEYAVAPSAIIFNMGTGLRRVSYFPIGY
jgi:dihydrodipicolinate synthase/N-acetylneuraminate lyase